MPLTDTHWIAPQTIFPGVKHRLRGDTLSVVMKDAFSWHNAKPLVLEMNSLASRVDGVVVRNTNSSAGDTSKRKNSPKTISAEKTTTGLSVNRLCVRTYVD